jgi:glycosyltransferase involved in cell wall biosynthesis
VPHGFQDKTVAIGRDEARRQLSLPTGVPIIGCVARLHPLKRLDANIRVVATRPDLHAAFVGQGPDEPRLRALAAELGVAERVHFVGELSPTGVGIFLAAIDVFAFPSTAETFGLAAVEAGQAGVPLVTNDLPVLREVLEVRGEACALFADSSDISDYAARIVQVIDDPAEAARLAALGRRLSERYSLDAMVQAYRDLILHGRHGPTPAHAARFEASSRP